MRTELLALLVIAACKREEATAAKGGPGERVAAGPPPLAEKAFYRVDLARPPACSVGAACEAELVLTALGDYHVNERYPVKLEVEPGGIADAGTFTRAGDKTGTLAVKLTPTKPGTARVTGTLKISVCTDDNCEIESPKIAFDVTAK
jgi:hypothetical protein